MKHLANISEVLTLSSAHKKDGRQLKAEDCDIIKNASIIYDDEKILWVGETSLQLTRPILVLEREQPYQLVSGNVLQGGRKIRKHFIFSIF